MIISKTTLMKYLIIYTSMEKCKLNFNKYRDRLKIAYPQYSDKELEEMFVCKVRYWVIMVENVDSIDVKKMKKK
jgi:hypothetical protein